MLPHTNQEVFSDTSGEGGRDDELFAMDWSDRYSLGVELIDRQHQVLFRLIDQLAKAIQCNNSKEGLPAIFAKLAEYTSTHFATEERLMEQYGFGANAAHHASHRALEESLSELVGRASGGEPLVSLQTMNFLRQWLYHHIDHVDRELAEFLLGQGMSTGEP